VYSAIAITVLCVIWVVVRVSVKSCNLLFHYLCLQESQKHRAGGMVCSQLSTVASEFNADVVATDPCPRRMVHAIAGKTPQNLWQSCCIKMHSLEVWLNLDDHVTWHFTCELFCWNSCTVGFNVPLDTLWIFWGRRTKDFAVILGHWRLSNMWSFQTRLGNYKFVIFVITMHTNAYCVCA